MMVLYTFFVVNAIVAVVVAVGLLKSQSHDSMLQPFCHH